jgi:hypothetical protein
MTCVTKSTRKNNNLFLANYVSARLWFAQETR